MTTEDTRDLSELHAAALAEGRDLTVYAGGDTSIQQDATVAAFTERLPHLALRRLHQMEGARRVDEVPAGRVV